MKEKILLPLPDAFKPQGKIKIELFDELTRKKIEEINTHNFISKAVKEQLFKNKMKSVFTYNRVTGGGDPSNAFGDPFYTMSLTDADHPENPENEYVRKGRVIGLAYTNKTYSGSDPLIGTYNAAESFTTKEQVHMVFDFPTHAGNGTFSSIYFHANYIFSTNSFFKIRNETFSSVQKHNNRYYGMSDYNFKIYDLNWNLEQEFSLNSSIYDFVIIGNDIYFACNNTSASIQKAPLTDPTNVQTVFTGKRFRGISYDLSQQRFYLSDNDSNILIYDKSFNLLDTKNFSELGNISRIFFDPDGLFTQSYFLELEKGLSTTLLDSNYYFGGVIDDMLLINYYRYDYTNNGAYLFPKFHIGSRSLLDSPVTKTSTNTMKITYDFILEA